MYVIAVYDINEKRVSKILKLFRRYLNWIQNSVFEGEITEVDLKKLLYEASNIINEEEDSIIIFKMRTPKWLEKEIIGLKKSDIDNFL